MIAWDGKTLAADKRCVGQGLPITVTKIWKIKDALVGGVGQFTPIMEVLAWYKAGKHPKDFPSCQREKDEWVTFFYIDTLGVHIYEGTPFPMLQEDKFFACGSGRDYAIAALHYGKTAKQAVQLACLYDVGCGNGCDCLTL